MATPKLDAADFGPLVTQDRELVAERNDLKLQIRAAAKPTLEP